MSINGPKSLLDELREEPSPALAVGALLLAVALIVGLPLLALGVELTKPRELSFKELHARQVAAMPSLDIQQVARGRRFYNTSCIACHAENARGVPNLGRDLVDGAYARRVGDDAFVEMIIRGRQQGDPGFTGPVAMPPRGGREDFDDQAIRDIVAYLRALQQPSRIKSVPIPEVHVELLDGPANGLANDVDVIANAAQVSNPTAPSTANPTAADAAAAAAMPDQAGAQKLEFDPVVLGRGKRVYASCIACHAKNGAGVNKQGASLIDSAFVRSKSDVELREFIKTGRAPGAPDSRLNLNMPPKGGNPSLKDSQLDDVVVYIRWLQAEAAKAK
jgi:mono/diheme cytochrome c family protein